MVAFDPGQVGVERGLIIVCYWRESERYARIGSGESGATVPPAPYSAEHARHIGKKVARSEGNSLGEQCLLVKGGGRLRIRRVQITRTDMQQQSGSEGRIQVKPYGLRQGVLRLQGGVRFREAVVLGREGLVRGIVSGQLHPGAEVLIDLDGRNRGVPVI